MRLVHLSCCALYTSLALACSGEMNGTQSMNSVAGSPGAGVDGEVDVNGNPIGTAGVNGAAGTPNVDPIGVVPEGQCATPGPRMVRRLSGSQFRNTLIDLFGDAAVPTSDVLSDPVKHGFRVDANEATIRDLGAQQLSNYAETVASWAVTNHLNALSSCTTVDAACGRQFVESFGLRAYREPLAEETIQKYVTLFSAEPDFKSAAEVVIGAMLQSPYVLYRREIGVANANGQFELGAFELASSLSYLITATAPDAELLSAAAEGRLVTRTDLEREAARLFALPSARRPLDEFARDWIDLADLQSKAKVDEAMVFTEEVRTKMLQETQELFYRSFQEGLGMKELFTADYTFVDGPLANFYGLNAAGDAVARVSLAGSNRAPGLLGHGAFLANHSLSDRASPVKRGVTVRERFLCQELQPPPANVDTTVEPPAPGATNRERYEQHSTDSACFGCHQLIDPIGFVFENYDALGRYQAQSGGKDIDPNGKIVGSPDGGEVPLTGIASLGEYIGGSDAALKCLAENWSYFAYGRDAWAEKECNDDAVYAAAVAGGSSLKSTLMSIINAPHFSRRVQAP